MTVINSLRSFRIGGIALFDVLATIVSSFVLSAFIFDGRKKIMMATMIISILLIIMAIPIHYFLGVKTMLNYYIGLSERPDKEKID